MEGMDAGGQTKVTSQMEAKDRHHSNDTNNELQMADGRVLGHLFHGPWAVLPQSGARGQLSLAEAPARPAGRIMSSSHIAPPWPCASHGSLCCC